MKRNILIGNRIPKDFFITKGCGESDICEHAGSFHLALKEAGIEQANIMQYSSILPSIANEIKYERVTHGAVLESIIASSTTDKSEICSAGIIFGWLYNRETNEKFGGLVCEQNGNESLETIENRLRLSLEELYINGFEETYELKDITLISESFKPNKKYGCALVGLCFTNYEVPILEI